MSIERLRLQGWPEAVLMLCTTRSGGVSTAPWDSLNLAAHVGDRREAVEANRQRLQGALPGLPRIQWLRQVHGTAVLRAGLEQGAQADACWTDEPGLACAVLTADCLPVLFASRDGAVVAAAHAGWRGLCAGILQSTLRSLPCAASEVLAWLGPCIGPRSFEVGPEVRQAFLRGLGADADRHFRPAAASGDRLLADLRGLAQGILAACGVAEVAASTQCTMADAQRYFSYRRDGQTGRMATLILRQP